MNEHQIEVKVDLTLEDVSKILAGLSELPAKHSMKLIMKLSDIYENNKPQGN